MTHDVPSESDFWNLAQALLKVDAVTRSTMMGLPCLRVNGLFFASFDPRTNSVVVKLPAARVDELINSDQGTPFAPAGRMFRQWVAITPSRSPLWPTLLQEALAFATTPTDNPTPKGVKIQRLIQRPSSQVVDGGRRRTG